MEDIFVPPESDTNKPRGQGGTGSVSPLADPPPKISVTSDEATPPGEPSSARKTISCESNPEIPSSERFSTGSLSFQGFHYDPDPFPPFWEFASFEMTPASAPDEDEAMDVGDPARDPSAPVSNGGTDDVISDEGEESEGIEEGEDDWSLVSDHRRDGHSTPSGFVLASAGTPSIPDDLMSFSTDQDDESSDEDELSSVHDDVPSYQNDVSSFQDHVPPDLDEVSFYDDVLSVFGVLGQGNSSAIRSKNLSLGFLSREDTLEEETDGSEKRMSYDLNDNEKCTSPLGDPLLSSIKFDIKEVRSGTEDIYHDTEDGEDDMETPRAASVDYVNSVTSLHGLCSASHDDPSMTANAGGIRELYLSNVPQGDIPDTHTCPESLQEESFFESGNFQKVDDAYEYYPTKIQSRKKNSPIGAAIHNRGWHRWSPKRQPKRGKAKRKSKDKRRWKLQDQLTDSYSSWS